MKASACMSRRTASMGRPYAMSLWWRGSREEKDIKQQPWQRVRPLSSHSQCTMGM